MRILPRRPNAPKSAEFAAKMLIQHKREIISEWTATISQAMPETVSNSPSQIEDNLPDLLEVLIQALHSKSISEGISATRKLGRIHGQQRAQLENYSLEQVIAEYQLLRRLIFGLMGARKKLDFETSNIINQTIDSQIQVSAAEFVRHAKSWRTGQKSAEAALEAQVVREREMLAKIIDTMPAGVSIAEAPSGKLILQNQEAIHLFAQPAQSSSPQTGGDLAFPKEYPLGLAVHEGKTVRDAELIYQRGDGRKTHLLVNAAPVRDSQGEIRYGVAVFYDIGERKRREELLQQEQSRLAHELREVELERETLQRFMSALSHDLRTPLAAAKMSTQLILRKNDDAAAVQRLGRKATSNIERVDDMIQDLLDISRLRAGQPIPLHLSECRIEDVVSSVLEDMTTLHGRRFTLKIATDIKGFWDCRAIRRIIENLCANAIKYGSEAANVDVAIEQDPNETRIYVHNEGSYIPPNRQGQIFEPFKRVEENGSSKEGWGIGLSVVKGISEAHGGAVEVVSNPGSGTTFIVHLPNRAVGSRFVA